MNKTKKIKLFIGLFYLITLVHFYIFFYLNFSSKKLLVMNLLRIIETIFLN